MRRALRWRQCLNSVYWCTYPSPGSSFLAREKAFLCAFFRLSGTVRIPCLRSLCTYNFLKSVHFGPRLAVYHLIFDCLAHVFTVYLPFFWCVRGAATRKLPRGRREAAKKMADTLVLDAGREAAGDRTRAAAASGAGARDSGSSRSYHPNAWIAQAAARVAARAVAGSGCPGRLGLKRARSAGWPPLGRQRLGRSGSDGVAD